MISNAIKVDFSSNQAVQVAPDRAGRVLIVDDDPLLRKYLKEALGSCGFELIVAMSGVEGLQKAFAADPDVIILDVNMPDLDGKTICRRFRQAPLTRMTPVVLLTGDGSRRAKLEGLEAGATDFVTKPCDLVELEVRIRNLVDLQKMTRELESVEKIIFSLASLAEAKDGETADHCGRLAAMALEHGAGCGFNGQEIKVLRRGAYLHDIGKIGVPDLVLNKKGPLSEEEWQVMRSHVEIGARILAPLRSLHDVLPIVRHHHEKADGSGYPDGLRRHETPRVVRAFQIFDVFDALTHDRCYHRGLSTAIALEKMANEVLAGWWDPKIFTAFVRLVT